nr:hypothetical protein [Tanacetum cinerariifolium]
GFLDNIYESVKASKPKTLDETIELANDLMEQKLRTYVERQTNNKRKADDSSRSNHGYQQHPSKGRMSPRYGYCKYHKKTTKTEQKQTRERKEYARAGDYQEKSTLVNSHYDKTLKIPNQSLIVKSFFTICP